MKSIKHFVNQFLNQLLTVEKESLKTLIKNNTSDDCCWHISHPINSCQGADEIIDKFIYPLRQSFKNLHRRNVILMGGESVTSSGQWVASMSHYVGNFKTDFIGIPAHDKLSFVRSGEFYHIENNKITEARIIIDFIDLMRQVGKMPLPEILGSEILFPAPATGDGLMLSNMPEAQSKHSVELVSNMLVDLRDYDSETFDSNGQTGKDGYWHDQMLWYGPCGIGSNYTYDGFIKDHRLPFLRAFPDRVGGNHYARFGDGNYVASGGWPSMTATHLGDYLGVKASGTKLTMRVMDFWRTDSDKIMENWVLIDMVDVFKQIGVDLFEHIND